MDGKEILINNLEKIHTTQMGAERIRRNLCINDNINDVVKYCIDKIIDNNATVTRKGKNYYVVIDSIIITINAYSFTIITGHKIK